MEQTPLETARLILRPFTLDDCERVSDLVGNPNVTRTTLSLPSPYTAEVARGWITGHRQSFEDGSGRHYAICLKADGLLVGCISLCGNSGSRPGEIGYWIGEPYWNMGIGTDSVRAIVDYGFAACGFHKIRALCFVGNVGSRRVLEKNGFQLEGELVDEVCKDGQYRSVWSFGKIARG
jgi:RimJ/RimL family protein N-acetyltransferase